AGPQMDMNVKQQRVADRDADDRYGISSTQERTPARDVETEQAAQGDDQVPGMPPDHAEAETQEEVLDWHCAEPLPEQEIPHPYRQQRAKAVTDKLESFEKRHASPISNYGVDKVRLISVRRFFARLARVVFGATGFAAPMPLA